MTSSHTVATHVITVAEARDGHDRTGFGETVGYEHVAPATHLAHQRFTHGRTGHESRAQRLESRRIEAVFAHEQVVLRGHAMQHRDLRAHHQRQGFGRVERRLQHQRGPTRHRAQHRAEAEDGRKRHRRQHAVLR
jgi:hypothetical protein